MLNFDSTYIMDPNLKKFLSFEGDKDLGTNNTAYNTHHADSICRNPNAPDRHNKSKNVEQVINGKWL